MAQTKIATCCYCGTRAALILRGDTRHELACAACGAPLHDLKNLKTDAVASGRKAKPRKPRAERESDRPGRARYPVHKPARKGKRKKSLAYWLFDEALDLLEDILD